MVYKFYGFFLLFVGESFMTKHHKMQVKRKKTGRRRRNGALPN
jgi:hypothetical protein